MYRQSADEDRSILVSAFNGKVFGIERSTGQIRWKFPGRIGGEVELAVGAGVVVACASKQLAFLEYATGRPLRIVDLVGEFPTRAIMLIDGSQIFVARAGEITCYTTSGDLLWSQPLIGEGIGHVSLALPGNARQADQSG
ncbi:MAG: PQQ-binding-like beta-propeller repeat protein [Myxococcales bacterium]|nr:PQQ-binding-like beta-propeller repeat protein [Myxococcales bacterium]